MGSKTGTPPAPLPRSFGVAANNPCAVDAWVPDDHSVIRTDSFKNPKELGEYLLYLNQNNTEYLKYLEWKKKPLRPHFQQILDNCVFFASCRLCKAIAKLRTKNEKGEHPLALAPIGNSSVCA